MRKILESRNLTSIAGALLAVLDYEPSLEEASNFASALAVELGRAMAVGVNAGRKISATLLRNATTVRLAEERRLLAQVQASVDHFSALLPEVSEILRLRELEAAMLADRKAEEHFHEVHGNDPDTDRFVEEEWERAGQRREAALAACRAAEERAAKERAQ